MPASPVPGPDSGWDFYADHEAVAGYITHRALGRSRNSLIEEPVFLALLPDVVGRDVLDMGCGYGHYAKLMASRGARVTGVDRAPLMIAQAAVNADPGITYLVADVETVEFPANSFDVVVSNLSLHYVADIGPVFRRVFGWLRPGGHLVFSVEHPVFTAAVEQGRWADGDNSGDGPGGCGQTSWIVSDYFHEGPRWGQFGRKYHHTVQSWVQEPLRAGFVLVGLREPLPSAMDVARMPSLAEDEHRPLFLVLSCRKPEVSTEGGTAG